MVILIIPRYLREQCQPAGRLEKKQLLFRKGEWYTGPIHFKSNVHLKLEKGAVISFSDNFKDYLPVVFIPWEGNECYNYSPLIYASNCENIAITGEGKLQGNGEKWWS